MEESKELTLNEYQEFTKTTYNPDMSQGDRIVYNVLKLNGESGELADLLGKTIGQGHALNIIELQLELGDILWHVADLCRGLGITLEELAQANVRKLQKRYPDGFDPEISKGRYENNGNNEGVD